MMNSLRIPLPIPHGWFCLSWSKDLDVGQVSTIKFCNREIVLFRTEEGLPVAISPFCPHLGAHLGKGGKVEGESIQCPFHGWCWDGSGKCTKVPYAENIPKAALKPVLGTYQVEETNGVIMCWYDEQDRSPYFDVPSFSEFNSPNKEWGKLHTFEYKIGTCLQEIAENDVDQAHFPTVHRSPSLPETDTKQEGIYRRTVAETLMDPSNNESVSKEYRDTYKDKFVTTFTRESWGLGTVLLRMNNLPPSGGQFVMLNVSSPVDLENSILRWQMRVTKDIEDEVGSAIIDGIANGLYDDIPIWENKRYKENPLLCDGDGPINKFRTWVNQFYK
ncbi:MAG: Rieske (2Fe-2S) protein [SAR86 cluster bacterium]|nr:Rieske (2Fe-2S) protein [SAR86 cluster bacterium]